MDEELVGNRSTRWGLEMCGRRWDWVMLAAGGMGQWWEVRVDFGMGRRMRGIRR